MFRGEGKLTDVANTDEIDVNATTVMSTTSWTHVVVAYDGTGLASGVRIYVNGVLETLSVTDDNLDSGDDVSNTLPITIGGYDSGSSHYTGDLDDVRVYDRALTANESLRLGLTFGPLALLMKFSGRIWKIKKEIATKTCEIKSLGKIIGEQEIRGQVFNNASPESIVSSVISNNTDLTYVDFGVATGLTIEQYIADGKLVDVITDMARWANRLWYVDPLARFHFEPQNVTATDMQFTHGSNARIFVTGEDDTELVNDLIVLGENKRYNANETFSGDGSTIQFNLAQKAVSIKVVVD